jgi:hypothetical protein
MSLVSDRLRNQLLVAADRKSPADVVSWLGAVQAQDFPAAKWGIGVRIPRSHDGDVEQAFNDGLILRTHVLRPTWHFVARSDIGWILPLSAPRVHAANAYYYRQSGLDAKALARSARILQRSLEGGNSLTRAELADCLKRARMPAEGLKLAYLMMHAELDGLVTSGPRRGKQFTYMLLEERAPNARRLGRQEAMIELVRRYFTSHGPATLRDFAWWSGLAAKEAQPAIEAVTPSLHREAVDGRIYFSGRHHARSSSRGASAFLLPNYDEYLIAYKDREPVVDALRAANMVARANGASPHHLIIGGRLAGSWSRTLHGNSVVIGVDPYHTLSAAEKRAVTNAVECYGEFLGMPATLAMV